MKKNNTRIPVGYTIIHGTAVIVNDEADIIRMIYRNYIEGSTIAQAAQHAGESLSHSLITRILRNEIYCGTDFFPAIIDRATFNLAREIAMHRNHRKAVQGRYAEKVQEVHTSFTWSDYPELTNADTPAARAEELYARLLLDD